MTHAMEEKLQMIDEYIAKLDKAVQEKNSAAAKRLQTEVIAIYGAEIDNLTSKLDSYGFAFGSGQVDYLGDAELLRGKLKNYRLNLSSGLHIALRNNDSGVTVNQQVNQEMHNSIAITWEETVATIQELPSTALSDEEKEILCGKLAALSSAKDKKTRWEKAQSALKWIAEKGIEVGIAALPYIMKAIGDTPA